MKKRGKRERKAKVKVKARGLPGVQEVAQINKGRQKRRRMMRTMIK